MGIDNNICETAVLYKFLSPVSKECYSNVLQICAMLLKGQFIEHNKLNC